MRLWRNWYTRSVEVAVGFILWKFKSSQPHHIAFDTHGIIIKIMIKKNDLNDYFISGIKHKNDLKIGVEHEKFVLDKDTFLPKSYDENNGIRDILERLCLAGWTPSYDDNQKTIVALSKERESITLEPGGQIELSGAPLDNIPVSYTHLTLPTILLV